jgi:hypothetical protein
MKSHGNHTFTVTYRLLNHQTFSNLILMYSNETQTLFSWGHIRRWVKTQKMGSWRLISQHMVISCGLTHPHMILGLDTCGYQSLAVGMVDFLHRGAPKTSRPIASTAWIISLCNINIRRIDDSMTVFPGIYLPSATQMIPEV